MAKLTFKPRATSNKAGAIYLFFNYGTNKRFRYSTGLRVLNISNWDKNRMRIKAVAEELDRQFTNTKLNELQHYFESAFHQLDLDREKEITNEVLKNLCDSFFGRSMPSTEEKTLGLLEFYNWFIQYYSVNPLMSNGEPMAKGTAKTYRNAYRILKRFSKENYEVKYDTISNAFYSDYLSWLQDQDYSTNYIGTQIKILKTMLSASLETGFHSSQEHNRKYFKKPSVSVENIYLSTDELELIENVDFRNVQPIRINRFLYLTPELLDRARDLFLISANTGLRVSDFNRLDKANILNQDGVKFIQIITKKNNKPLTIPLNSIVKRILKKYDGAPPPRMPDQHINYAIKEIGRIAGINQTIAKESIRGGKEVTESFKKYELITNHTGRRSFCTNAYLSGMPTIDIMAISGHSTERVFYNYIKVNDLQRAQKIAEHKFFN